MAKAAVSKTQAPAPTTAQAAEQTTVTAPAQTQAATQAKPVSPKTTASEKYIYHTVQKGDTLWGIAEKYNGVTVEDIRRLNNLNSKNLIQPGQKLKINLKG